MNTPAGGAAAPDTPAGLPPLPEGPTVPATSGVPATSVGAAGSTGSPERAGGDDGRPDLPAAPAPGTSGRSVRSVLLAGERLRLFLVALFGTGSVACLVAGPILLGTATNILFSGVIGARLPAGQSKARAVADLRAHGHDHLAAMAATMDVVPGAPVDLGRLGRVLLAAAGVFLLGALLGWAQNHLMAGVAMRVVHRLREAVTAKLHRLPLRYFDRHPHGEILSRVTNDIDNVTTALQEGPSPLLTSVLTVLGLLGVMFWLSPVLAVASLVSIPLLIAALLALARRAATWFARQWKLTGELNALVEEGHTGHALVLAFGRRAVRIAEFGRRNDALREAGFRGQYLSGLTLPTVLFVGNLNYVVIAVLGGYRVSTGAISLGVVQAFIQFSRRFTLPVAQVAGQVGLIQSGQASAARVLELLDEPEEPATGTATARPTEPYGPGRGPGGHRVELRGVSFRYEPDRPLIEDLSLVAEPGTTVAIVGPTGAGKTTLVNLLMRFYEADGGSILLDGTDYRDLTREQVRRRFGMVLQDTWLFAGTIAENIGYGRRDATREEIVAAARSAHVDDFVGSLPDGYDTALDEDASVLSAGQRQLLTIARAFLADPGVLILDEATSSVDLSTEAMIRDAMDKLRHGRTGFVIAHRLSTVRDADLIVVIDAGRVVEQGTHDELLARRGAYHHLHAGQSVDRTEVPQERCSMPTSDAPQSPPREEPAPRPATAQPTAPPESAPPSAAAAAAQSVATATALPDAPPPETAAPRDAGPRAAGPATGRREPEALDRRVVWVSVAVFALLLGLASRYGYFVDELYFLDTLHHLSASYVDQPALAPLLMRVEVALFGTSVTAIRVLPALAAAATVLVGGLTAREFGGTRRAQFVTALGVGTMPVLLSSAHVANTTSYDLLAWAAFALVALKVERTGEQRWWLAGGVVLGLGMTDSRLIASFALTLVIGLLITGGRSLVLNRWALAGGVITVLFALPDLWWQTRHDWAGLTFTHTLNQQNGGAGNISTWIIGQLLLVTLALLWVWMVGVRHMWRSGNPMWKALIWSYAILFVLFAATTGARIYYLAGAYVFLLAAGAVALDGWLEVRRRRIVLTAASVVTTALMLVVGLPLLPVNDIGWTYGVNRNLGDTVGWPQLVASVDTAWHDLPAEQRASAVIYTQNDGEAGAINHLGRDLPTAVSAQNTNWWWGPGNPKATTVLAVVPGPVGGKGYAADLRKDFGSVREVGRLSNPYDIHNKEYGGHIYVCTDPREPWGELWKSLLHYAT
ncbi:putative ABC transporter [Actinacidiphila reveromycinica]|uniref:Fatty acid ABC transporter ATP-binding/permease protein n=1 Tax=Actinacidiphila reveromycinica TaxID=659352 RepID=A0A7U3VSX5_9ACTN|nr:ABC transporter transmembrane domain-containing protein [Streptomyces sp. SN-593]BBB02239.1 putative ABC transporter [Streptomyces sp. SN-593]